MNEHQITELITRVLAKEATAEEQNTLHNWIQSKDENKLKYEEFERIWNLTDKDDTAYDANKAWQKLESKINSQKPSIEIGRILRIAAGLLIFFGIGLMAAKYIMSTQYETAETANNESKQVILPDGSIVWLKSNSIIRFKKEEDKQRTVDLNGEAFFEVVKNPNKPFIIHTENSITKVLGTSFNLIAYKDAKSVKLSVATGRVSFTSSKSKQEQIVVANESALIDEQGNNNKLNQFNKNETIWKDRKIVFDDQALKEVFAAIEHYFEVRISISDPNINNCHFTGEFNNPSIKDVMDVICKTMQFSYEQKQGKIIVKGKGCE